MYLHVFTWMIIINNDQVTMSLLTGVFFFRGGFQSSKFNPDGGGKTWNSESSCLARAMPLFCATWNLHCFIQKKACN